MPRPITAGEILDELRARPGGAAVAAFDADGTLWDTDIGEAAFARARAAGLVDDATLLGPVREYGRRWGLELGEDPDEIWQRLADHALADGMGDGRAPVSDAQLIELYGLESWIFAGRTEAELVELGEALFAEGLEAAIFDEMRALLDGLRALDVRVVVLSGSLRGVLLPGTRRLGIDDADVHGTDPHQGEDGRYLASAVTLFGEEKGVRLDGLRGAAEVAAAFGDAPAGNDRFLLERAALPVVVNPRGRHRTFARNHGRMRALYVGVGNGQVEAE